MDSSDVSRFMNDSNLVRMNKGLEFFDAKLSVESPEQVRERLRQMKESATRFFTDNIASRSVTQPILSGIFDEVAELQERMELLIISKQPPKELRYWLQLDKLTPDQALPILCGFCHDLDYDHEFDGSYIRLDGLRLFDDVAMGFLDSLELHRMRREFVVQHRRLRILWESRVNIDENFSLNDYAKWAIGKGHQVDWLEWALENSQLKNDELVVISPDKSNKDVNSKSESSYINIIAAMQKLYWEAAYPNRAYCQATVLKALEPFEDYSGLKPRNLKDKLTRATRAIP